MRQRWPNAKEAIITGLGSILLVGIVFVSTPITKQNQGYDSDGIHYGAMAGETSFAPHIGKEAPWCYRILTPFLASLLPFQTLSNFRVLAFVSNVLSIIVLALILTELRFPPVSRLFGILLYAGSFWTLKFSFYSPAYIDYQTQLLLLLIIYLTARRAYIWLPFIFLIAALQKESLAAFSVFSVVHILRHNTMSRIWTRIALVLAVLIIPFATIFFVRFAVEVQNEYSQTIMISHFARVLDPRYWPIFIQSVFSGVGIIPIILLVNYEAWARLIRRHWEWAVYALIAIAFLFGGTDKARLFLYALPLGAILATCNAEHFKRYALPKKLVLWGAVVLVIHWYIGGCFSSMESFIEYLARMVPVHSSGRYVPYLILNLGLALAVFIFTVQFVIGEWCFRPKTGFTHRDTATGEAHED